MALSIIEPNMEIAFDKVGNIQGKKPTIALGLTDLLVISHGWHQDGVDARGMYRQIVQHLQSEAHTAGKLGSVKLGVIGVHWPSDKYSDDLALEIISNASGDQEKVAANLAGGDDGAIERRSRQIAQLFDIEDVDAFAELAVNASDRSSQGDQDDLVSLLRQAASHTDDQEVLVESGRLLSRGYLGSALVSDFQISGVPGGENIGGGALNLLDRAKSGIAFVLNQFAYFELKVRAGVVGAALGSFLNDAAELKGVRIHLVGHSFGARLVTAAACLMDKKTPKSLTMLQGALSHNALGIGGDGVPVGAFRKVVSGKKVEKILITHTWNDRAVGIAYPWASRVSRDNASAIGKVSDRIGGANDKFGGIGANGALRLGLGEGKHYNHDGKIIPNLSERVSSFKCDFIKDHGDICTPEIGRLLVAAFV